VQRREAAHRQPNDVRFANSEMIENRSDVIGSAVLRIRIWVFGYIGGRITPRVERNAAVAPAEMAHLRLPTAMIPGKFMHEDQRRSGTRFLVVEAHSVFGLSVRHAPQTNETLRLPLGDATRLRLAPPRFVRPVQPFCEMEQAEPFIRGAQSHQQPSNFVPLQLAPPMIDIPQDRPHSLQALSGSFGKWECPRSPRSHDQ